MQDLWGNIKNWVESHALPVGIGGIILALVGTSIGIAALVGGGGDETTTETTIAATAPSTTEAPEEEPETEETDVTEASEQAPAPSDGTGWVAVKVDNAPQSRPQLGLDAASLIIEVPVEGGLTRFIAMYPAGEGPDLVGPVRSLRPVDADLIKPFSSLVVSTGGQQSVLRSILGAEITQVGPEESPGWQILERPAPNNVFVGIPQVESVYPPPSVELEGLPSGEWASGDPATAVTLPFGDGVGWDFAGGEYLRSEGESAFEVLPGFEADPIQLAVDNLVVMFASERSAGFTDTNGAVVPTYDVIGSGRLLVFSNGEVVEGTWLRGAQEEPYSFFGSDGSAIGVPAGRTYVAVVPRELEVGY